MGRTSKLRPIWNFGGKLSSGTETGLLSWPPDLLKRVVQGGVVILELCTDKRITIVVIKVGLGPLSKILLMVGGTVVPHSSARVEKNPLICSLLHGLIIGVHDGLVLETKNLIVIGVGELVKNDRRVLEQLPS